MYVLSNSRTFEQELLVLYCQQLTNSGNKSSRTRYTKPGSYERSTRNQYPSFWGIAFSVKEAIDNLNNSKSAFQKTACKFTIRNTIESDIYIVSFVGAYLSDLGGGGTQKIEISVKQAKYNTRTPAGNE